MRTNDTGTSSLITAFRGRANAALLYEADNSALITASRVEPNLDVFYDAGIVGIVAGPRCAARC